MSFQPVASAVRPAVDEASAAYFDRMIRSYLGYAVDLADQAGMRPALGEALCAALDTVAGGAPSHDLFGDLRQDAAWWADIATPLELEAYVGAGLRAIERRSFAERAKKRLFVALWESMPPEDRRRFLSKVDPDGQFVKGAA